MSRTHESDKVFDTRWSIARCNRASAIRKTFFVI
jgi:hypothetical protein